MFKWRVRKKITRRNYISWLDTLMPLDIANMSDSFADSERQNLVELFAYKKKSAWIDEHCKFWQDPIIIMNSFVNRERQKANKYKMQMIEAKKELSKIKRANGDRNELDKT